MLATNNRQTDKQQQIRWRGLVIANNSVLPAHRHQSRQQVIGRQPRDVWLDQLGTNIRPW